MTLYRGPGGTGSATSDADTTLYQDFLNQTIAARDAALQAEINAELAETNAETAETNAETAETNAETASTNAASSASAAASSASSASTSASNASTSASAASTSATAAASSASSASSSASAASTSASNAATSATNAANSASSASTSATNAANSASTATTQATNAASSATAAASSASSASTSATNAANSASAASTSATNAATSATSAAASATAAAASAASINPADLVHISGTETITGAKTFSQTITGSITGNAGTVTNGVYTTGDQTIAGTKTFSSNPILSAGTANGVAYLNGSKVLTTGSALTFDGTNLGVGTSSPLTKLDIKFATDKHALFLASSSYSNGADLVATNDAGSEIALGLGGSTVRFYTGASEQMRLTSTGLGIGTSSPTYKLDVTTTAATNGGIRVYNSTVGTNNTAGISFSVANGFSSTNQHAAIQAISESSGNTLTSLGFYTSGGSNVGNATERMRLDSSGNLGLGVTPSAWGSFIPRAIELPNGVGFASQSNAAVGHFSANAYYDGSWRYKANGVAARYALGSDTHAWYTAPSGTAGNAISFTQAMTLDASGNLAIGKTSASGRLDVRSNGVPITWGGTGIYDNNYGTLTWGIDLAIVQANAGYGLAFTTNGNNERARIDSSGRFFVATTGVGTNGRLQSIGVSGDTFATAFDKGAASAGAMALSRSDDGAVVNFYRAWAGGGVGNIAVTSTATAYNTSSDYRLKDNPQPLTGSGAFIDALQPKTWNWKANGSKGAGFLAHEAQAVSPSSVTGEKDAVDAEGKPIMQAMEYGSAEFIANIIAELQSLRARVAALESN